MPVGTRSVLFGAHCFLLHGWFVAEAWRRLYGFPWDPRLWVAFFVHDLGYIGKPNMDGAEGEEHVHLGADIMERLFGKAWGDFSRYHSRFVAKRECKPVSTLCIADKLAIVLTPGWLYLPMARATGELAEYRRLSEQRAAAGEPVFKAKYVSMNIWDPEEEKWLANVKEYLTRWVAEHKDGKEDTWTPAPS